MCAQDSRIITVSTSDLACSDSILRTRSADVEMADWADLGTLFDEMVRVFRSIPYAGGLSAIQLGVPLRVALFNLSRAPGAERFMINPVLSAHSTTRVTMREGCLSLPGYKAPVARYKKVRIQALDRLARPWQFTCGGYEAAIVQHELDHMDGRLYWDHLPEGCASDTLERIDNTARIV